MRCEATGNSKSWSNWTLQSIQTEAHAKFRRAAGRGDAVRASWAHRDRSSTSSLSNSLRFLSEIHCGNDLPAETLYTRTPPTEVLFRTIAVARSGRSSRRGVLLSALSGTGHSVRSDRQTSHLRTRRAGSPAILLPSPCRRGPQTKTPLQLQK